jgi:23S rRNA pseudouridine955/2504/2580 synthase
MQNDAQNSVRYLTIIPEEDGQRLDNYLLRVLKGVPKSHIYRIIRSGEVRINSKRVKPSDRLVAGDAIRVPPIRTAQTKVGEPSPGLSAFLLNNIIFEDERLLVLAKPAGLAVHGGSGLSLGVIEAMRQIRPDLTYLELVHRLDKETSGCLLLAKKRSCLRAIQALLEAREVQKTYWAVVVGAWKGRSPLEVDVPLLKSILQSGERMVFADPAGKSSQTQFKLLENYADACWVEAQPKTGRTHQIRVHAAKIGHPILGDQKYSKVQTLPALRDLKARMYLHAHAIQFTLNGKFYHFTADLDATFAQALQVLRKNG